MKKLLPLSLIALFGGFLMFSTTVRAQEDSKQEKKVRIKTVKVENGKELVTDTTFIITDDMTADDLKAYGITSEGDEVDVTVDVIVDGDGKHETKKVIVVNGGNVSSAGEETVLFHSGDSDGKAIIMWTDEDGKEMEIELRDAGLKNKPNRLDAEEMNINIDNGVVDFSFKTQVEGSPKIAVYNVYGDKVFSGRPELMNGTYEIKMDLSQKQFGMYCLQVVIKNASFTERLKL